MLTRMLGLSKEEQISDEDRWFQRAEGHHFTKKIIFWEFADIMDFSVVVCIDLDLPVDLDLKSRS